MEHVVVTPVKTVGTAARNLQMRFKECEQVWKTRKVARQNYLQPDSYLLLSYSNDIIVLMYALNQIEHNIINIKETKRVPYWKSKD